jgi:hypothetical protein
MLPPASAFAVGIEFYLRRHGLHARLDATLIAEALLEAERLSAGTEREEPAALFFACAGRSQAFFPQASRVVPHVTRTHATALGLDLRAADVALTIHHTRILRSEMAFGELRDWFAARLVPTTSPPR